MVIAIESSGTAVIWVILTSSAESSPDNRSETETLHDGLELPAKLKSVCELKVSEAEKNGHKRQILGFATLIRF